MFASAPIPVITKYILVEVEVTGFTPGNKCRFYQKKFLIMYVTGSTGKTEDTEKLLNKLDLFEKNNKTTLSLFMQKTNTSNII